MGPLIYGTASAQPLLYWTARD